MSSPRPKHDGRRLHKLTSAVIDGVATDAQRKELTELLRDDPAARDEYLALVDLHAILATEPAVPSVISESQPGHVFERPDRIGSARSRRWTVAGVVGVAVCLLVAFQLIWPQQDDVIDNVSFVTVVQLKDAEWSDAAIAVSDRVGPNVLNLTHGFARLEFDTGVEVTLEGPAEFEVLSPEKMSLASGLMTATVPPGAEGFTVDTPTAEVVDLGTSFGIDLGNDGFSNVSVFDGEVEIRDTKVKRLLSEGESVRIGVDSRIEDIDFDPRPFERVWPVSSGIVGSTEAFRFVPPWPKRIRFVQSDDAIFVASEGSAVYLDTALAVNISEPGTCERVEELTPSELQVGELVRSFVLHFSPTENLPPRRARRVSGSITFDRPVLGLIVRHEELLASMNRFSPRVLGEGHIRRQLELNGASNGDRITLSDDRRTVTVDLISPVRNTDLIRIVTDGGNRIHPGLGQP